MADWRIAIGLMAACGLVSGCRSESTGTARTGEAATATPEADNVHLTFTAKGDQASNTAQTSASQPPAAISASADISDSSFRFSLSSSKSGADSGDTGNAVLNITAPDGTATLTAGSRSRGAAMTFTANGKVLRSHVSGDQNPSTTLKDAVSSASIHLVRVESDYGGIKFTRSATPGQISVEADVSFSGAQAGAAPAQRSKFLSGFRLSLENSGGALRVAVIAPADFPKEVGFSAAYRIAIPEGLSLDARTANGAVEADNTGVAGSITAKSDYGSVTIVNSGQIIDARTSNGPISISSDGDLHSVVAHSDYGAVSVAGPAKTIDASSSNGSITVTGALQATRVGAHSDYGAVHVTDCGGKIDATSSNGEVAYSVEAAAPTSITCKSDYGTLNIRLGDCSALSNAQLSTSNGSVNVTAPRSASLSFHAHTDNGSIDKSGISGDVSGDGSEKSFSGTLNGGRSSIRLQSDYGSLDISAL